VSTDAAAPVSTSAPPTPAPAQLADWADLPPTRRTPKWKVFVVDASISGDLVVQWREGNVVLAVDAIDRSPAALEQRAKVEWEERGSHRARSDPECDHAAIVVGPSTDPAFVDRLERALLSVERHNLDGSGPAFAVHRVSAQSAERPRPEDPLDLAAPAEPLRGLRFGRPSISGRLTEEDVTAAVQKSSPRFQCCYALGLRGKPDLAGRLQLRIVVGADGVVGRAEAHDAGFLDPGVVECIVRAGYYLEPGRPQGGIVFIVIPIDLAPR
jgi:hypothetical protein